MNWEAFWFVLGFTLLGVALCVALAALAFWSQVGIHVEDDEDKT